VIPAVTHVDGSGRLQTVNRQTNRLYWHLLKAFETLTGVPVLLKPPSMRMSQSSTGRRRPWIAFCGRKWMCWCWGSMWWRKEVTGGDG
jgi:hypothetical protein